MLTCVSAPFSDYSSLNSCVYVFTALSVYMCNCCVQSAWMILETIATFASSLVDEIAVIGFWGQCITQQDGTSGSYIHVYVSVYLIE